MGGDLGLDGIEPGGPHAPTPGRRLRGREGSVMTDNSSPGDASNREVEGPVLGAESAPPAAGWARLQGSRDKDLAAVFMPSGRDERHFLRRYGSRCLADAPPPSALGRWVCVRLKGHEGPHG